MRMMSTVRETLSPCHLVFYTVKNARMISNRRIAMRETWTFHSAGQLLFGRNAIHQLGEMALRLGAKRVLIVTDPVLAKTGLVERVRDPLERSDVALEVFTGGEPEPSFRAAGACIDIARQFRPDTFLGLGGGSNMDLAKITATIVTHGGDIRDYIGDDNWTFADFRAIKPRDLPSFSGS
jgi:alcohol dehydrogenase class IV